MLGAGAPGRGWRGRGQPGSGRKFVFGEAGAQRPALRPTPGPGTRGGAPAPLGVSQGGRVPGAPPLPPPGAAAPQKPPAGPTSGARTVSPERYICSPSGSNVERPQGSSLGSANTTSPRAQWEAGSPPGKRQRKSLSRSSPGGRRRRGPQGASRARNPIAAPTANRVTCDIRLRVRAEYCEHGAALAQGVVSRRPQSVARQLDLFGQAMAVLKSRDLGSVVCDIKFSELSYLDAFWGDYLSGALLQALRGVFLTEALREAVGREPIRLLVSVDEGDYEAGRRRLLLLGGRPPGGPQALPPR
ncbi:DNA-binding death effector domain-containing protein 2 isoform X2 [Macrotis lagotis]|uniref:DNA-binding death effector domain-containing protein 2 isoform X2 n=1 Tax=Macrotis lagotis TaxID=92651 RepID=UPI003D69A569